jgi:transposase-like protein
VSAPAKRPIGGMLHHGSAGDRRSCSHLRGHFPTHRTKIATNRVWKLPQVWKHRTLPHLLGKPTERVSHSSHTPFLLSVNQTGSVLVSSGGQKILSLDREWLEEPSKSGVVDHYRCQTCAYSWNGPKEDPTVQNSTSFNRQLPASSVHQMLSKTSPLQPARLPPPQQCCRSCGSEDLEGGEAVGTIQWFNCRACGHMWTQQIKKT